MKKIKILFLFSVLPFIVMTSGVLYANLVPGDCRNPDACLACHGGHIIGYHDCTLCHEFPGDPYPDHRFTSETNCDDCHDNIPTVDPQCSACHTNDDRFNLGCERGAWSLTGPMSIGRFIHAGSPLDDGNFLVTGGGTPPQFFPVNTAEILNPNTRIFTLSGGTMSDPRWSHTQTTLGDGRVLVAGGRNFQSPAIPGAKVLDSADIYDPNTDAFSPTGPMNVPRRSHKDILLDNGMVLITGGGDSVSTGATMPLDTAEIYDPATGTFRLLTSTMTVPRQFHTMVKLPDGKVLVIGGSLGPGLQNITTSVDVFDPATETFTEAGQMISPRITQVATLLRDGRVLLAFSWDGLDVANNSEIYDPVANTFTPTSGNPIHGKVDLDGIRLLDGTVVCPTGGNEFLQVLPTTALYRPETDDFVLSGSVQFPRTSIVRALLKDGRPLLVGGLGQGKFHAIAEIYTPSILSQAEGLKNVLSDLPDDAYSGGSGRKTALIAMAEQVIKKTNDCSNCHRPNVKEEWIKIAYEKARKTLDQLIIPRINGCSGGNPSDDWIAGCDNQDQPFAVASLMLKTLDAILGNALPPEVTVDVDQPTGEYPHTVQFTGTASDPDGSVALFFWDFGDGSNSSEQDPMHTYTCPGDYTAALTVVDNDGLVGEASVEIHVDYTPGISASFACDLQPQYQAFCGGCHPPVLNLDLTTYSGVIAGSENGPVVLPFDPENSSIVQITDQPRNHANDVGGEPLSPTTKEKQRAWIVEGAMDN